MHTLSRGRIKAATPGLSRPRGRKRRPTPMVWRAGARYRHSSRFPVPARLLLIVGAACVVALLFVGRPWI
jgi:hypothetical protein